MSELQGELIGSRELAYAKLNGRSRVTGLPDREGRGIYANILKFIRFQLTKARGSC